MPSHPLWHHCYVWVGRNVTLAFILTGSPQSDFQVQEWTKTCHFFSFHWHVVGILHSSPDDRYSGHKFLEKHWNKLGVLYFQGLEDCPVCHKRYTNVKRHFREVHLKEKKFACEICGARFSQRITVESHKLRKHSQEKAFPCPRCGKRFAVKIDMTRHVKCCGMPGMIMWTCPHWLSIYSRRDVISGKNITNRHYVSVLCFATAWGDKHNLPLFLVNVFLDLVADLGWRVPSMS